jgi:hypothetical protein
MLLLYQLLDCSKSWYCCGKLLGRLRATCCRMLGRAAVSCCHTLLLGLLLLLLLLLLSWLGLDAHTATVH